GGLHPVGAVAEGSGGGRAAGDHGGVGDSRRELIRLGAGLLPSQLKFHKSAARFKGFSGPIGSGKSRALCAEALALSLMNVGRTGLIGAPTYPMLRDATQAALLEMLEEKKIA